MGLLRYLRGDDILEDRVLTRSSVGPALAGSSGPVIFRSRETGSLSTITPSTALRVSAAYACVRVLADSVASLPVHVFRRTAEGRVRAGQDTRAVQLLQRPAPGMTSADLFSDIMASLNLRGNAFVGKYRAEGEIVQLGLLNPDRVTVEQRGLNVVYVLDDGGRRLELGPADVIHIRAMGDGIGLRGLSPVSQAAIAIGFSAAIEESGRQFFERASRPSGMITGWPSDRNREALEQLGTAWDEGHSGVENMYSTPIFTGDLKFVPLSLSNTEAQFIESRELSAVEISRIFRVPPWLIGAKTGDSLTYANSLEQNRAFATHSLRPWVTRIERAFSNDAELFAGGAYLAFDMDGLLRSDTKSRFESYEVALRNSFMTVDEVRALEDLPALGAPTQASEGET